MALKRLFVALFLMGAPLESLAQNATDIQKVAMEQYLYSLGLVAEIPDGVWTPESQAALDRVRSVFSQWERGSVGRTKIGFFMPPGEPPQLTDAISLSNLFADQVRQSRGWGIVLSKSDAVTVLGYPSFKFDAGGKSGDQPWDWCGDLKYVYQPVRLILKPQADALLDTRASTNGNMWAAVSNDLIPALQQHCPSKIPSGPGQATDLNIGVYIDGIELAWGLTESACPGVGNEVPWTIRVRITADQAGHQVEFQEYNEPNVDKILARSGGVVTEELLEGFRTTFRYDPQCLMPDKFFPFEQLF